MFSPVMLRARARIWPIRTRFSATECQLSANVGSELTFCICHLVYARDHLYERLNARLTHMTMHRRQHTSRQYEQELQTLNAKLLLIGHKAQCAIENSTRALVERSPSLAQQVVNGDDQIDGLELEIDELCLEILAREQPVASDLRFITTAMKIVGDIERVADNGVNIARRCLEIVDEPELKPIVDVPVAAKAAQRALKDSLDAFVNGDAGLALRVIEADRYIDDICEQMLRELLTYMSEDASTIARALRLTFVARNLKRVGDHAANIAEMVIFLVDGHDVRHCKATRGAVVRSHF